MKTASIGRATVLALLALALVGTGCKKETSGPEEEPERTEESENASGKTLYTVDDEQSGLCAHSVLAEINVYDESGLPTGTEWRCFVEVGLMRLPVVRDEMEIAYGEEVEIVEKPIPSTHIVAIDLITNADFDDEHPKGSSLNDIMTVRFLDREQNDASVALTEYFKTYPTLDITDNNRIFTLEAQTLPLEKNYIEIEDETFAIDVTLKLTLDDETVIIIDPIPTIPSQPAAATLS